MRTFLLLTLLVSSFIPAMAQKNGTPAPLVRYSFKDTVKMPGVPKTELYRRALAWFRAESKTHSFLEDIHAGTCTFTAFSSVPFKSQYAGGNSFVKGRLYYRMQVQVLENGYAYELTDFVHQGRLTLNTLTTTDNYPYRALASSSEWYAMVWAELKQAARTAALPRIGALEANMAVASPTYVPAQHLLVGISLEELHTADIKWERRSK